MTKQQLTNFFKRIREMKHTANMLERKAQHLRERLYTGSLRTDAVRTDNGRDHPLVEDLLIELTDTHTRLKETMNTLLEMQHMAEKLIRRLQDFTHQLILLDRYLRARSWEELAREMYMSTRHIQRLHQVGLTALAQILSDEDLQLPVQWLMPSQGARRSIRAFRSVPVNCAKEGNDHGRQ